MNNAKLAEEAIGMFLDYRQEGYEEYEAILKVIRKFAADESTPSERHDLDAPYFNEKFPAEVKRARAFLDSLQKLMGSVPNSPIVMSNLRGDALQLYWPSHAAHLEVTFGPDGDSYIYHNESNGQIRQGPVDVTQYLEGTGLDSVIRDDIFNHDMSVLGRR